MGKENSRRKVRAYSKCCSIIVKCVKAKLSEERDRRVSRFGLSRVYERLKYYTGLGNDSITKLLKDEVPSRLQSKPYGGKMSKEELNRIRPAIIQMIKDKKRITLNALLEHLEQEQEGWNWSRSSLHKALHRLRFKFNSKAANYYDRLQEDSGNIAARIQYLTNYREYVDSGRPIVYMDETWINSNAVPSKSWHDGTIETVAKVPPGKGQRWIIIGAGTKNGWVDDTFVMWKGNCKSEDYHTEMNGDIFEKWVKQRLLPNVPRNAVIVMDRARYHLMLDENCRGVSGSSKKEHLANWLVSHDVKDSSGTVYDLPRLMEMKKPQIWALCKGVYKQKTYLIQGWLREWNNVHDSDIKLNILPVAHPQLNAIEQIWGWLKAYVAKNNHDFKMKTIKQLAMAQMIALDASWWEKACHKANKFAEDYIEADDIYFDALEQESQFDDDEVTDELSECTSETDEEYFDAEEY